MFKKVKTVIEHIKFVKKKPNVFIRLVNNTLKKLLLGKDSLRSVDWAMTYTCNSLCVMCSCELMKNSKRQNMTVQQIEKVWQECLKLGAIHVGITGGEPLTRDIDELVEIVKIFNRKRNVIISMVTNSLLLTKEKLQRLKDAGLDFISISIESLDEKENDELRGIQGHFKAVKNAIKWAKELDLVICLSSVITKDNIDKLQPMIDYTKEIGVFFLLCQASASGKWQNQAHMKMLREHESKFLKLLEVEHLRTDFILNYDGKMGCPGGKERIYFTPYGDVLMCPQVQISYGNVLKEPISVIWKRMSTYPIINNYAKTCKQAFDLEFADTYIEPLKDFDQLPVPYADETYQAKIKEKIK